MGRPVPPPTSVSDLARFKAARRAGDIALSLCNYMGNELTAVVQGLEEPADHDLRHSSWLVVPAPVALADRRIEITGAASREAVESGLASGANVYVADLAETGDISFPWHDLVEVVGCLAELAVGEESEERAATLMLRPRRLTGTASGPENSGELSAGVLDVVLFATLCAALRPSGEGIYIYLPELGSRREAALWESILLRLENALDLPQLSIVTTAEISSRGGVEQVEEILWEVRRRSVALSVRYRDEILGVGASPAVSDSLSADVSREELAAVVATCNRRGAQAICGVRDEIPLKPGVTSARVKLSRVVRQTRDLAARF